MGEKMPERDYGQEMRERGECFTHCVLRDGKKIGEACICYVYRDKSYCYYKLDSNDVVEFGGIDTKRLVSMKVYEYLLKERVG